MKSLRATKLICILLFSCTALLTGCGGGQANATGGNTCAPYQYCMNVVSNGATVQATRSGFGINYSGTLEFQFTPAIPAGSTVNLVFNGTSMFATATSNGNALLTFQVGGSSLSCIFQQNPTTIYAYIGNGTQAIATTQTTWTGNCP
jgi:hypothetical protein